MSVEFYPASGPGGNNESLQGTTVGGSKPLHRFLKGQPKIVGVIVLALGVSLLSVSISVNNGVLAHNIWTGISPAFLTGTLFLICGILFIVTEHNPSKKTVTLSLALSIVTILMAIWNLLHIIGGLIVSPMKDYDYFETGIDNMEWSPYSESMRLCLEALFLFYTSVGIIIFIIMASLARAALRSTKSQAIVMTTMPTQASAE